VPMGVKKINPRDGSRDVNDSAGRDDSRSSRKSKNDLFKSPRRCAELMVSDIS